MRNLNIDLFVPQNTEEKMRYTGDKVKILRFRVNDTLYDFVLRSSSSMRLTPAEFLRSVLYSLMTTGDLK